MAGRTAERAARRARRRFRRLYRVAVVLIVAFGVILVRNRGDDPVWTAVDTAGQLLAASGDDVEIIVGELARFQQNFVRYVHLADIMKRTGLINGLNKSISSNLHVIRDRAGFLSKQPAETGRPFDMGACFIIARFRQLNQRIDSCHLRRGDFRDFLFDQVFKVLAIFFKFILDLFQFSNVLKRPEKAGRNAVSIELGMKSYMHPFYFPFFRQ